MSNQKTMVVILLVALTAIPVAATIGAIQIVQAKKSHQQSSDDGDISSSSPPSTTTGPINDGGFSAGWKDGQSQALGDERSGIDNTDCGTEHSNLYCSGYIAGYTAEHAPFNALHPK
jgi:hypothetical protein